MIRKNRVEFNAKLKARKMAVLRQRADKEPKLQRGNTVILKDGAIMDDDHKVKLFMCIPERYSIGAVIACDYLFLLLVVTAPRVCFASQIMMHKRDTALLLRYSKIRMLSFYVLCGVAVVVVLVGSFLLAD